MKILLIAIFTQPINSKKLKEGLIKYNKKHQKMSMIFKKVDKLLN